MSTKKPRDSRSRPAGRRPAGAGGRGGRAPRRRLATLWVILGIVAVVLAGVITTVLVTSSSGGSGSGSGSNQAPRPLASVDSSATGQPVDGIQCEAMEQVLFHIHAHLAVYVAGSPRIVPAGIGIAPPRQTQTQADGTPYVAGGACFYWLHSHTQDGVIHIESPVQRSFTLGDYFDIWNQPLSATQVGPAQGAVTAYVNGSRFNGDPRDIPLNAHALIQLDVGTAVAPVPFTFPPGL